MALHDLEVSDLVCLIKLSCFFVFLSEGCGCVFLIKGGNVVVGFLIKGLWLFGFLIKGL